MADKRTKAVSNIGFTLVPKKKGDVPEYFPVKILTKKEMKELGYNVMEESE